MQKRPISNSKLRKSQSQSDFTNLCPDFGQKWGNFPISQVPISHPKDLIKHLPSHPKMDYCFQFIKQAKNPKESPYPPLVLLKNTQDIKYLKEKNDIKKQFSEENNQKYAKFGNRLSHNQKLPPMTPDIKRYTENPPKNESQKHQSRFSYSGNDQSMAFQMTYERNSHHTYKKPVVALNPIFKIDDPYRDVLSNIENIPETIKKKDFIKLYYENQNLKQNEKILKQKIEEVSFSNNNPKTVNSPEIKQNNPSESVHSKSASNCFVNYITNNYNVNFVSPFKQHSKNQRSNFNSPNTQIDKLTAIPLIDFSKFIFKKKGNEESLNIKKKMLSSNYESAKKTNPRGSSAKSKYSDYQCLEIDGGKENVECVPKSEKNSVIGENFSFQRIACSSQFNKKTQDAASENSGPLDFTFSFRPK